MLDQTQEEQLVTKIQSLWGVTPYYAQKWLTTVIPDDKHLEQAFTALDKRKGFSFFGMSIPPQPYILDNPLLIGYTANLCPDYVKSLSKEVYNAHLKLLLVADRKGRNIGDIYDRLMNDYNAQIFIVFRYSGKKSELTLAKKMSLRKISHHTYASSRMKLISLASRLEPTFSI
jgi:hypothetical protein